MKSFSPEFIENQPISQGLLRTIRLLGEFKGRQELFQQQAPQALETLRQVAVIQSTESSNRIEGITALPKRIEALVARIAVPRNRPEQEIAGYRDVLNTVHTNYTHMRLTAGLVKQLHRDLLRYTASEGGNWKIASNDITEEWPDGTRFVRFEPVPPFAVSEYMEQLHTEFTLLWHSEQVERLLLIPAYILDFLYIHPFLDGNGRMARLLALLLLYQAGYEVGKFVSLERIIEESKESYYDSLYASSQGWHEGKHSLRPWTEYFLGVVVASYREFEERVGTLSTARGTKTKMVIDAVDRLPDGFRIAELERLCPGVTRDMIRVVLKQLREDGIVWCDGAGRNAVWRKRGNNS